MEESQIIFNLQEVFGKVIPSLHAFLCSVLSCWHNAKLWDPIHLSWHGPKLPHLMFVDDLVLFAKASLDQVRVIKGILHLFVTVLAKR